jgi:hypothetical protein
MPGSSHSHAAPRRRPDFYAGARRRFSGIGTIIAGFVALVLVLGALLTSELGQYGNHDDDSAPTSARSTSPSEFVAAPQASGLSPSSASPTQATPTGTATKKLSISDTVAAAMNTQLDSLGCAPVKVDPRLVANAQSHVVQMIYSGYYDVVSQGGTGPQARARAAGYTGQVTESIVLGADTAVQATQIAYPPPVASRDALPVTVQVVSKTTLTCGWKAIGAQSARDSRRVAVWSIVLGK